MPGFARDAAEQGQLFDAEFRGRVLDWQTDPPRDPRRSQPKSEEWQGNRHRAGCMRPKETAPPSAIAGANHIAAYEPARSVRALRATSPEVTHSSKCRCVTETRQRVRPIAVRLRKAAFGRNAKVSPIWPSVRLDDDNIPRKCIR